MKDRGETARQKIKEALERAIEQEQYVIGSKVPLSVSTLLRLAGVSRSTFYAYYENMGDALEELTYDFSKRLITALREGNRASSGGSEYLGGYRQILEYVYRHQRLFQVLMQQKGFERLFVGAVQEFLYEEYKKNYWEFDRDILRYSAVAGTSFVYGMILEWEKNDFDKTPGEMAEIFQGALRLTLKIHLPNP